jgi:hypothetical protein
VFLSLLQARTDLAELDSEVVGVVVIGLIVFVAVGLGVLVGPDVG